MGATPPLVVIRAYDTATMIEHVFVDRLLLVDPAIDDLGRSQPTFSVALLPADDGIADLEAEGLHSLVEEGAVAVDSGDLGEVVGAHRLLLVAERAVVGRRGVQVARLQAGPQRVLVVARAERRAHHMTGGIGEVRVAVDAVVDHQVLRQHLAEHALAFEARARDGFERIDARGVHHVERHAEHFGNANGAIGRLALTLGRP